MPDTVALMLNQLSDTSRLDSFPSDPGKDQGGVIHDEIRDKPVNESQINNINRQWHTGRERDFTDKIEEGK